ncbi:MAG: hypothetical protein V5B60_20680 [Accumulibacter sp.]|jgi:hypothetical protein|uniref:hypothetical protein n=1 Tax=Accumulibacter sp. TaxID=2053492 RepID=UPI002FC3367D
MAQRQSVRRAARRRSVVTWGDAASGGDSSAVAVQLGGALDGRGKASGVRLHGAIEHGTLGPATAIDGSASGCARVTRDGRAHLGRVWV